MTAVRAAGSTRAGADPWPNVVADLEQRGYAIPQIPLLTPDECAELREHFDDDRMFRSTVDMARYRFGLGTYRDYAYDLPPVVAAIRETAYPALAVLANVLERAAGPARPVSPGAGGVSGALPRCRPGQAHTADPALRQREFQHPLTVALTEPGVDFTGGENLFVEARPRAQSRGTAVTVPLGHAVVFPTRHRPVAGARGHYRATIRHGVSTVTSGTRFSLGIIFHDAT